MSFTEPKSKAALLLEALGENLLLASPKLLVAVSSPWLVTTLLSAPSSYCLLLWVPISNLPLTLCHKDTYNSM